jgi:hypothetical protein
MKNMVLGAMLKKQLELESDKRISCIEALGKLGKTKDK